LQRHGPEAVLGAVLVDAVEKVLLLGVDCGVRASVCVGRQHRADNEDEQYD
jgi:hypothetical protein